MKKRYSKEEKLEIIATIKPIIDKLDNRLHIEAKLPDVVTKGDAVMVDKFLRACEAAHTKYFTRVVIDVFKSGRQLLEIKEDLEVVCKNVYA